MWTLFGLLAVLTTGVNYYRYKKGKDYRLAMAMALSFTALTLSSEYSLVSDWVQAEDWAALMDVVPTMVRVLWMFTIISIVINIIPAFLDLKKRQGREHDDKD